MAVTRGAASELFCEVVVFLVFFFVCWFDCCLVLLSFS